MERTCCGKPCETPYCPHCGKEVTPDPLGGLLKHLRQRVRECRQQANRRADGLRRTDLTPEQRSRVEHRVRAKESLVAKWQAWHDALAALVRGEDGTHGG